MYICSSQPKTPRLCNSPVFSAGTHDNKLLYLATIDKEEGAQLDVSAQVIGGRGISMQYLTSGFLTLIHQAIASPPKLLCTEDMRMKEELHTSSELEVDQRSYTPLVFSATGGTGPIARVTYGRIASLLAKKRSMPYHQVIS